MGYKVRFNQDKGYEEIDVGKYWVKPRVTECAQCYQQFYYTPYAKRIPRFCSRRCQGLFLSKTRRPKFPKWCPVCGQRFEIAYSHRDMKATCGKTACVRSYKERRNYDRVGTRGS